ncbi:type I restriction enzyme, S subunit [Paraburkholderia phenazinium]|uniref:Type I restriction enzyme, S subunit n=1 Tax=Paraburkholderia phenazinium TaxID=60549 RepID=A0A1G7P6D2_9BURK|nr:restriction endonuclease subunit S [Paraburkholderia phenazinium]SDF81862.1 type I restriction enzyme, S subunit [Paraburkholderia phenazinium]
MTTQPLRDLCAIRHGGTPSKANAAFWLGDIPWVSPKDMKSSLIQDAADHITTEAIENSATSLVPAKTILVVVRSGILAHTLPVAQAARPLAFNQDIKALTPDASKIDPDYVYWFLRARATFTIQQGVKKGATVHSLRSGFLESLPVPMCSEAKQREIVDLLSRADGIVRLRRDAQRVVAGLVPATFAGIFGDPATNPKDWPMSTLGDVITAADYGSSAKSSSEQVGLPMIRMGNVTYAGDLELSDLKYVSLPPEEIDRFKLLEGDILFNRTNSKELVGKTGLWDGSTAAILASYFIRLRVDRTIVSPTYVWAFMNSAHMKRVLFATARGAIGQSNINSKELKAFRIPVPPEHLQKTFEEQCQALADLAAQQRRSLEKAEAAFRALMAQCFPA